MYSTLEVAGKVTAPEISADNIETTPSDAALKTNTRPTRWPGISRLVETVLYDMRDGSEVDAPGVIAQRVRAVAPDFVYRMRDGRLAVRYARLALACATDPEPVERLAALEARIEALESRL